MQEGEQHGSSIFKKRFARRKTTHRPFTFARKFETEGTPAAQNQVVEQVGDRGVVITSPVQVSRRDKDLSITDIVRECPVPVLIAHASPKDGDKENKENTDQEEDDQWNTSQRRRSGRSHTPSELFLSRLQHPHAAAQLTHLQHTPDEQYIGSKKSSNIDAEVSFEDNGNSSRRSKKNTSVSSSRSSKQASRAQNASKLDTSVESSQHSADISTASSSKAPSTKRASGKKKASAFTNTSTRRRGQGQPGVEKTPSPVSSRSSASKSGSSSRMKKSVSKNQPSPQSQPRRKKGKVLSPLQPQTDQEKVAQSSKKTMSQEKSGKSSKRGNKKSMQSSFEDGSDCDRLVSGRSRRGQNQSLMNTSTRSSSAEPGSVSKASISILSRSSVSPSTKRAGSAADPAGSVGKRAKLSPIAEQRTGVQKMEVSKKLSGESRRIYRGSKSKDDPPLTPPVSAGRKRVIPVTTDESGPSPPKTARKTPVQETKRDSSQKPAKKIQSSMPMSMNSQSGKRTRMSKPASASQNGSNSVRSKKKSQTSMAAHESSPPRVEARALGKLASPKKGFLIDPERSTAVVVQRSPANERSSSFWKASRQTHSSVKPRTRSPGLASPVNDDIPFGVREENSPASPVKRKGVASTSRNQGRDQLLENGVRRKRSKTETELAVITDLLIETETDIVEKPGTSQGCRSVVHKAFTFTKKQLKQAESQLLEITELTQQINKLKSVCRSNSNEAKENTQQKVILQKEIHSLQQRGVDDNLMRIDEWLKDFQVLRKTRS